MGLYIIYALTILIGIYAVYINLPAIFQIGIPTNEMEIGRFFASFFPVIVGLFMIYFGVSSIYNLYKKEKDN